MLTGFTLYSGPDAPFKLIDKWIKIVNREFRLSRRNKYSTAFFYGFKDQSYFYIGNEGYFVAMEQQDMWGFRELTILSYYLLPEARTLENLNALLEEMEKLAKALKIKRICQGSHLNEKLPIYLKYKGYKISEMRKDL